MAGKPTKQLFDSRKASSKDLALPTKQRHDGARRWEETRRAEQGKQVTDSGRLVSAVRAFAAAVFRPEVRPSVDFVLYA